jgi:hypothetical protein
MPTFRSPPFPSIIPTKSLKLSAVPNESEPWPVIGRFALTFHPSEDDPYNLARTRENLFLNVEPSVVVGRFTPSI